MLELYELLPFIVELEKIFILLADPTLHDILTGVAAIAFVAALLYATLAAIGEAKDPDKKKRKKIKPLKPDPIRPPIVIPERY